MRRSRSRPRDSQGRFIASSKFNTTFGPTNTPIINPTNRYVGIKQEEASVDSKVALERKILNQDRETIEQIIFGSMKGIVFEDLESTNIKDHP